MEQGEKSWKKRLSGNANEPATSYHKYKLKGNYKNPDRNMIDKIGLDCDHE